MSTIDLNAPPPNHIYRVSVERAESRPELYVRLGKEVALFCCAVGLVGVIAWICVMSLAQTDASADEKKWAMTTLGTVCGGLIGYLIRK